MLEQVKEIVLECAPLLALWEYDWKTLASSEQARMLRLLIERIEYDGRAGTLALAVHPQGAQRLAEELHTKEITHGAVPNP